MHKIASRVAAGAGRRADLDLLVELTHNMGMMPGLSICGLPDGAAYPIRTIVTKFRSEWEEFVRSGRRVLEPGSAGADGGSRTREPGGDRIPIAVA